ncbi:MAG: 16S rRNA (guanine(966)-N(2))-methyltransferase RsmD [Chlorobiota bacterium]|nr:16S rRNA (guanine(966)-N(2))-methyltransferase RsmD [Chlorobiota bacterium]QQS66806.1 MAG: 16S rRNA (guanine(966)-N(2))-methyltransferase RsmD [Chlorobiota bacterium]
MRIISGELRGRLINSIKVDGLRPTTDRVRESLFSILNSRINFNNLKVLDLYSGTGALGIESLSRGALSCDFIELNKMCSNNITQNINGLNLIQRAKVYNMDCIEFLLNSKTDNYELIFADPPYFSSAYFNLNSSDLISRTLKFSGIFVFEHSNFIKDLQFTNLKLLLTRSFGESVLTFYTK